MDFEKYDYLNFKKAREFPLPHLQKDKPETALSVAFKMFLATFIVIFCIFVVFIAKMTTKVDIEYTKGNNLTLADSELAQSYTEEDEDHRLVDQRLKLLQQQENAPSEAKIVKKEKTEHEEVIAQEHIQEAKKIDKIEKIQAKNKISQKEALKEIEKEAKETKNLIVPDLTSPKMLKKVESKTQFKGENNIITSKVLIGRFSDFNSAKEFQAQLKEKDHSIMPYVRKVGDVYSVQIGSFQDFAMAKSQAKKLKEQGYDTWIFQQ